jgi:uncharacterized protein (TIGR00156 family)
LKLTFLPQKLKIWRQLRLIKINFSRSFEMKKRQLVFVIGLLVLTFLTANAQQGGYKGPGAAAMTVAEAKNLRDDSPVILRGKIERFLGDEKYLFSDASGNITIEIDNRIWGTLSVDQNDVVEITGEIDRDFSTIEVEVKTIKKV